GKVSIIVSDTAFRLPAKKSLIKILKQAGPLVAPSANPEGLEPAKNMVQARGYFGDKVDFYLPGGTLKGESSILIKINKKGEIEVLRGIIKKYGK
ncbi:MAG: Sua5/YciO/YrdC/YwlC family protein, partial [bacterium]